MNREEAIWNEVVNGGDRIHLYKDALTEEWRSFGVSAFALKELCCGVGCGFRASFSVEMQMPCVTIANAWIGVIECAAVDVTDRRFGCETLSVGQCVDTEEYFSWAQSVRTG